MKEHPKTSSMFDSTPPRSAACSMPTRPWRSAEIMTISSVALPKEALIRPPATGPHLVRGCS